MYLIVCLKSNSLLVPSSEDVLFRQDFRELATDLPPKISDLSLCCLSCIVNRFGLHYNNPLSPAELVIILSLDAILYAIAAWLLLKPSSNCFFGGFKSLLGSLHQPSIYMQCVSCLIVMVVRNPALRGRLQKPLCFFAKFTLVYLKDKFHRAFQIFVNS